MNTSFMSLITDWWQPGHGSQCRDYVTGWTTEESVIGFQGYIRDFPLHQSSKTGSEANNAFNPVDKGAFPRV